MKLIKYPSRTEWAEILKRPSLDTENLFDTVRSIIDRVKDEGDRAVKEYEAVFDKVELSNIVVTEEEWTEGIANVGEELKAAITLAKKNI